MKTYSIIVLTFLLSYTSIFGQTLKKEASKSQVYVGEEFYYIITIENVSNLSDLNRIEDNLGPDIDLLGVEFSPAMQLMTNWGYCSSITYTPTTPQNNVGNFVLNFNSCSGSSTALNTISFKLKVRFNDGACVKNTHQNTAELHLNSSSTPVTASNTISLDHSNPFQLQKNFVGYDAATGELQYRVSLSSKSGSFYTLDFLTPQFFDDFTVPNCFNPSINDISVREESSGVLVPFTPYFSGPKLSAKWSLPPSASKNMSSISFLVKVKVDCTCPLNQFFDLLNEVDFDAKDICGNNIKLDAESLLEGANCDLENTTVPGEPLCVSKSIIMDNNDLGITMQGCKGSYFITVENCSNIYEYNTINIGDLVPSEVKILGVNANGWTYNQTGNQITASGNGLGRGQSHTIEIKFQVRTPLPSHRFENCAKVEVKAKNVYTNVNSILQKDACASIKTVPNTVALVQKKSLCSEVNHTCGTFNHNFYLPGDDVEYELRVYNYGTVEGTNVVIDDQLPSQLRILNPTTTDVRVYQVYSGSSSVVDGQCNTSSYTDITPSTSIGYSATTNRLRVRLNNNTLKPFTCDGVTSYLVTVKARIQQNTPNGTYLNQFTTSFRDPSTNTQVSQASNTVPFTVNKNALIIADKRVVQGSIVRDCKTHTTKVKYQIRVANMGEFPVNIDIEDQLVPVANVSATINPSSFLECASALGPCTPTTPSTPSSVTNTSFKYNQIPFNACEMKVFEFEVTYNTNFLTKGTIVEACNEATITAYTGTKLGPPVVIPNNGTPVQRSIVVSGQSGLLEEYFNANTAQKQLEVIETVKALKAGQPDRLGMLARFSGLGNHNPGPFSPYSGIYFGKDMVSACLNLWDCLEGSENVCYPNPTSASATTFRIDGMNSNGIINTTLTVDPSREVTKIEYLLTDVNFTKVCDTETIIIRGRPYQISCGSCDGDATGIFYSTTAGPIGNLNLQAIYPSSTTGSYHEINKVVFEGAKTSLTTVTRDFKFPTNLNCTGNWDFVLTAIVTYKDCSVCYVSDTFDFYNKVKPWIQRHDPKNDSGILRTN